MGSHLPDPASFFAALDVAPNTRTTTYDDMAVVEVTKDGKDFYRFTGHASVCDEEADLGEYTESIEHGAGRRVLRKMAQAGQHVPFLAEHRQDMFMGSTKTGRVKLDEDGRGIVTDAFIVINDLSTRVKSLVDSGDMQGMSIGFICGRGNSALEMRSGKPHRRIKDFARLLDVSVTWDPAYAGTDAQFRSMALLSTTEPQPADLTASELGGEADQEDTTGAMHALAARRRLLQLMSITMKGDNP